MGVPGFIMKLYGGSTGDGLVQPLILSALSRVLK